jgi:hypothetical protein
LLTDDLQALHRVRERYYDWNTLATAHPTKARPRVTKDDEKTPLLHAQKVRNKYKKPTCVSCLCLRMAFFAPKRDDWYARRLVRPRVASGFWRAGGERSCINVSGL